MSGTDRTVMTAGPLLDIVDDEWRADTLPEDGAISRAGAPPPRRPRAPSLSDAPFSRRVLLPSHAPPAPSPAQTSSSPPGSPLPRTRPRRRTRRSRTPPRSGPSSVSTPSPSSDARDGTPKPDRREDDDLRGSRGRRRRRFVASAFSLQEEEGGIRRGRDSMVGIRRGRDSIDASRSISPPRSALRARSRARSLRGSVFICTR